MELLITFDTIFLLVLLIAVISLKRSTLRKLDEIIKKADGILKKLDRPARWVLKEEKQQ